MFVLIVAGILSLPSLIVLIVTAPVVALLSLPAAWLLLTRKSSKAIKESNVSSQQSHVIVTGGSSGIGLGIACAAASEGITNITLLARKEDKLLSAKKRVEECFNGKTAESHVSVQTISVDVTKPDLLQNAAAKILDPNSSYKTFLFCCAGEAFPESFEKLSVESFSKQVQLNQLGTIYTVHAFLPYIQAGTITLCSSMGGQVGVYGYTAYSPTKYALRGFAEVLHAELSCRPIHVQIAFPPDTDTAGFHEENKTKPEPTKIISKKAGLFQPEDIGRSMLNEARQTNPRFAVYFDVDGWMLSTVTAGFAPVTSWLDAISQLSLTTLFRWVSLFYLLDFHRIIQTCDAVEQHNKRKLEEEKHD